MSRLSIKNLVSGYRGNRIIRDLSLEMDEGTLVLMGPSGSGKSTLLLTILGIVEPEGGSIALDGKEIARIELEERNIGYLPQDYGLFPHLNVMGNVTYGLRIRGYAEEDREKTGGKMLELVELGGFGRKKIQELSGGQRQRVGLARALAIRPDLLLLDEPLSNIDPVTKAEVASQLKGLFKKLDIPIILVTHNHEDALFLSERLAILIDGKIEQTGTAAEIIKRPKTPFIRKLLMPFGQAPPIRS